MGNNSQVVDFSTKNNQKESSKLQSPLSSAVEEALSIYLRELNTHLTDMLNNADDHLFDKSEKDDTNANTHFAALRTLRVQKDGLVNVFKQEIINQFRESVGKFDDAEFNTVAEVESLPFEKLSLVEKDELEENIAVDSMVNKAKNQNKASLDHLRQRLDTLLPTKVLSEEENPFEPIFVCSAFGSALKPIELGIEFKLVLYKYFERNVVAELAIIYQDINQYFIDQGILPELKSQIIKKKTHRRKNQSQDQEQDGAQEELIENVQPQSDNTELLNLLGELLAERRGNNDAKVVQQVDTKELVSLLSNIQTTADSQLPQDSNIDVRAQIVNQLPSAIGGQIANGALGQFNDDMIDVVTMLFDFILDDENLHSEVKAVIARLQIPILKVGLVDKSFFSDRKHPARLLLNELAHAGLSWDPKDPGSEPMLASIKSISEKVCSEFNDNVEIFQFLLSEFSNFKTEHVRRAKIFEKRTREAEEGKAKAEGARATVNRELKKICYKKHMPPVIRQLLKNVWVHVMFLESLKGEEKAWDKVCMLAKMLVWSAQPVTSEERLVKLTKNIPALIKNLKLGFNKISFSHIEASGLLDRLEDLHRDIIKQGRQAIEEGKKDAIIRLKPVDPLSPNQNDNVTADSTEEAVKEQFQPVEIEEIAFSAQEIGLSETKKTDVKITPESRQIVENLHAGCWVELKLDGDFMRCKLAARITSSGKFIFVNRSGIKVAEYLTNDLSLEYQLGCLRMLDDEALFDRALESVISNLRNMKSGA